MSSQLPPPPNSVAGGLKFRLLSAPMAWRQAVLYLATGGDPFFTCAVVFLITAIHQPSPSSAGL